MEKKRELIRAYLTLADEKLAVANELMTSAHYDDALSRAYYVMFYAAKAMLLAIDSDPHSHSGVISQFSQHFIKSGQIDRQYGRMLSKAMQAREATDYNPMRRPLSSEAEQTITHAEAFLTKMKELLADWLSDEES